MKNPPAFRTSVILLATGASAVALLSACTTYEQWRQGITGERSAQAVHGMRRAPLLNPATQPPPAAPQAAMQQAPAAAPNPAGNPYDYYDAAGNPTGPMETAGQAAPSQPGFFDRMFGGSQSSAAAPNGLRKPLPGNPYYSDETTPVAPLPPAPQSQMPMTPEEAIRLDEQQMAMAAGGNEPASAAAMEEAPAEPKTSWFSRMVHKVKEPFETEAEPAPTTEELSLSVGQEEAPPLSSVPPVPEQFAEVKSEQQEAMEALQSEHMQAQAEKAALMAEPSQMEAQPVELVQAPKESTVPPVTVQPTQPQQAWPAPSGDEPVLLGHVSDDGLAAVPPPVEQPAMETVTAPMPAEEPAKPVELSLEPEMTEPAETTQATPAPVEYRASPEEVVPQLEATQATPAPVEYRASPEEVVPQLEATQATPAPVEYRAEMEEPVEETLPALPAMEPAVAQEAPAPQQAGMRPRWWEGWGLFGERNQPAPQPAPQTDLEMETAEPAMAEPMEQPASEPMAPLAQQPAPSDLPPVSDLPEMTPSAPPVAEAAEAPQEEPAAAPASLPSPSILQQVRMLPPSRYLQRLQAIEQSAESQ